jgi:hypothetical protein
VTGNVLGEADVPGLVNDALDRGVSAPVHPAASCGALLDDTCAAEAAIPPEMAAVLADRVCQFDGDTRRCCVHGDREPCACELEGVEDVREFGRRLLVLRGLAECFISHRKGVGQLLQCRTLRAPLRIPKNSNSLSAIWSRGALFDVRIPMTSLSVNVRRWIALAFAGSIVFAGLRLMVARSEYHPKKPVRTESPLLYVLGASRP